MSLAYLFWHWPADDAGRDAYEQRMREFHAALGLEGSRTLRLDRAPFDGAPPAPYEDWYPVPDWAGLGALNERATSGARRAPHDAAAERAQDGAGAVYALVRGEATAPTAHAAWAPRPAGMTSRTFLAELDAAVPGATVWQRQMVLGPAPEFAVLTIDPVTFPWPATVTCPRPL